ncbi:MAG: hypothetical protein IPN92_11735 [Chromatiaceae bacterium]|nr:hypothetical protein [Chromatiaceae bacterium]
MQRLSDDGLVAWVGKRYWTFASPPAATAPVMVHQIPRFLAMRRSLSAAKVALLVFDGLAIDQCGVQVLGACHPAGTCSIFEEGTSLRLILTLTTVSRQVLFAGLKPRELAGAD